MRGAADFPRAREISRALYLCGRLSDVPTLVNVYEKFSDVRDADIIPVRIADLLEAEEGSLSEPTHFEDAEYYRDAVLEAYQRLADDFGSDRVYVFHGKLFGGLHSPGISVRDYASRLCVAYVISSRHRRISIVRASIERGELRPLAVAAIVEAFLESAAASTYEDGVRYFFGHAIP